MLYYPEPEQLPSRRLRSERLKSVLWLITAGKTNAEIASELMIEKSTVCSHIRRLFQELNVETRIQIVILGVIEAITTDQLHRIFPDEPRDL